MKEAPVFGNYLNKSQTTASPQPTASPSLVAYLNQTMLDAVEKNAKLAAENSRLKLELRDLKMKSTDDKIMSYWNAENPGHKADRVSTGGPGQKYSSGPEFPGAKPMLGDYFTHDHTGQRFVCGTIAHTYDSGIIRSVVTIRREPV